MMNGSNYSLSDIAAATGSNNRANDMWGGDGFSLIWLVLIFAIFGWGGFGGWGGGFGGNGANGAGFQGWATRADINESFALNDIQNGIRGIQQGICDSTYALNNTMQSGFNGVNVGMLQGFNGVQQAINADTVANMQNTNALQSQFVDKTEWLLAAPQEIDLTTEQITAFTALATYYPTTHISVTSEQLDGYTVFNYPISMANGWNYVKKQLNDNRDYIYDMDIQIAEAYVNSEYAVALTELEV